MNPSSESSDSECLELSGVRILLVEDSWQLGVAIASLLREFGAEVSGPVATSAEALGLVCKQPPDAALVDFNLRGGELADDLIERLHELGIYVIVTTGYTELPSARRHAVPILHKPITEAALLGSLRAVAARKVGVTRRPQGSSLTTGASGPSPSSASRRTAELSGLFALSQCGERPDR